MVFQPMAASAIATTTAMARMPMRRMMLKPSSQSPRRRGRLAISATRHRSRHKWHCVAPGPRRAAGFADAARVLAAFDDVHVDLRHLIDAQHAVIVEVGLAHTPLV